MDNEQTQGPSSTTWRLTRREVAVLVSEGVGQEPEASRLSQAVKAGLLSSGQEAGDIWGPASVVDGPAVSLDMLQEVAIECAGVATCLHVLSLGAAELSPRDRADLPEPATVALFSPNWRPSWESLNQPPEGVPQFSRRGSGYEVHGQVGFVDAPPPCGAFVLYGEGPGGWERVLVLAHAPGLVVEPLGETCGLAALRKVNLTLDGYRPSRHEYLGPGDVHRFLRRYMLGLSAIALGNAVGALRAARGHAQDRHQGGKAIEQHGAVQQMLGASSVRVSMCAAALAEVARRDCDHPAATWRALAAKLQIGQDSVTVVSDCLQVFGACGVTQDCGLATRLRDALTVNSMVLAPNLLRRLCANAPFGGPR